MAGGGGPLSTSATYSLAMVFRVMVTCCVHGLDGKVFLKKLIIPLDPASRRITKGGEGELLIRMTHFNIVFSLSSKPCGNDS